MSCSNCAKSCACQITTENCVYDRIKNYDLEGAKNAFKDQFREYCFNNIGNGFMIRSIKNHLICFTAALGRMLSINDSIALVLKIEINEFINKIEATKELSDLSEIVQKVIEGFGNIYIEHTEPLGSDILLEALRFIKNNLHKDLTLDIVASRIHISKSYLSSIFVKHLNCKFKNYINQLRIKKAVELLVKSDYSMTEIAASCGFKNQHYFSTVFKKTMACSPMDYRKNLLSCKNVVNQVKLSSYPEL